MTCDEARDALSADLDGELDDAERPALTDHLAACPDCRAYAAELAALHRRTRLRPADRVPDLVGSIMAAVDLPAHRTPAGRHRPVAPPQPAREWARYALLTVALTQVVLAVPALVLGNDTGASIHVAREVGTFDIALAAGLLFAAWQPRRASGLLPLAVALSAGTLATSIADMVAGRVPAVGEAHHALDLAGVAFLVLVARAGSGDTGAGTPLVPIRRRRPMAGAA